MQKVANRSLLVTTSVPGHHRPLFTKQLKCQRAAAGRAGWEGKPLKLPVGRRHLKCGKGARVRLSSGAESARLGPIPRPIWGQSAPGLSFRLNPRHSSAIFLKKARRPRNLGDGPSVSQRVVASQEANTKMPTIYTGNDFVLVRLHEQRARTISDSVTSRERVGRSMSSCASTSGETRMNTSLNHGSAKIYQFPAGGRSALGGRRYEETKTVADLASTHVLTLFHVNSHAVVGRLACLTVAPALVIFNVTPPPE